MIYVMSDIHGHMARFRSVMKKIDLKPEDTLYVLGDVIDRNADGIRILRELMAMPNVKMPFFPGRFAAGAAAAGTARRSGTATTSTAE